MENLNKENQKPIFSFNKEKATHYLVLSRYDLIKIWKYSNLDSIKRYGKKVPYSNICLDLAENKKHSVNNKKQIVITDIY